MASFIKDLPQPTPEAQNSPKVKRKGKYKPLPKCQTEKEALRQIREELKSDMDNQLNKQEVNQK